LTPIQYMIDVGTGGASAAGATTLPARVAAGPADLEPIDTPLVVSGVPASLLQKLAPELDRVGLAGAIAGGASGSSPITTDIAVTATKLKPGDPVAAQLVTGDVSFAATGTVTHVDG